MNRSTIHLSRKITAQRCDRYLAGKTDLKTVKLNFKHKANWDAAIKGKYTQAVTNEGMNVDTCASRSRVTFFHCPACRMAEVSSNKGFHRQQLDLKIKCPICTKNTLAKDWTCPCGDPWFRCSEHAYDTHQGLFPPITTYKATVPCERRSVKRKATSDPLTYEAILQAEETEHRQRQAHKIATSYSRSLSPPKQLEVAAIPELRS